MVLRGVFVQNLMGENTYERENVRSFDFGGRTSVRL